MNPKYPKILLSSLAAFLVMALLAGPLPGTALPVRAAPGDTTRVSVGLGGAEANNYSKDAAISGDGRYVAFISSATNLVSGDTNNHEDIFVHDRQTGTTTRVSVNSSGLEPNGDSYSPALSYDGRYVAFASDASNLVSGDTNGVGDIFVHDRTTGQTTRVSVDSSSLEANDGSGGASISSDGRYVAFSSAATNLVSGDTNNAYDVFVHDRDTGQTTRVSVDSSGLEANDDSGGSISSDGRYVALSSSATNLVAGDTNGKTDAFVHDLQTGATTRVSVNSFGVQANMGGSGADISADGRYVMFSSYSHNLTTEYDLYDGQVYLHDRQTGQTTLASRYSNGEPMFTGEIDAPTISRDGRYMAYGFYGHGELGLMNIWVRDLQMGETVQVTDGGADSEDSSYGPSLSADGSLVAYTSRSNNLVDGDTNGVPDVFVSEISYGPDRNPTVLSVDPACKMFESGCSYPTPASVSFLAIFSERVTGVTADDFSLEASSGLSGAAITGVSGSGDQYLVTVDTGAGDGTLRVNVIDDDSILDSGLNPLGGAGTGNGDFTSGHLYRIDKNNPIATGITLADPNPTGAENVHFIVSFSEGVWPVDASDFALTITGSIAGAAITGVTDPDGDGYDYETSYTVTVNTGTGDGTLRLDLIDDDSIRDVADTPLGGAGAGNGDFTTGEAYTIDKSIPSYPSVTGILRADHNPTLALYVDFSVTFTDSVSGVDSSDFTLVTTGSISGAFVENVNGSGNAYIVTINTGSGDGELRLDLIDDDSIQNASGYPLGEPGAGNGNFTTGETYTIDKSAPSVTSSLRADPSPTSAASVNFTVTFSESVTGVDASDFSLTTTGTISGATITGISGSGNTYTVTAASGSGDGTLRLDVLDNDSIMDVIGQPLGGTGLGNGNFTTGEAYTFARTPVNKIIESFRSTGANDGWVLESSEDSNQGGSKDSTSHTFVLGDDAQDRQFRAILHFPTHYLPDNAVITRALLMIKKEGLVGEDPFTTHQNILVDIRPGAFGYFGPFPFRGLQNSDFQSPASMDAAGIIENNPLDSWYWAWLDGAAFTHINLRGITQLRLRFQLDDNDDLGDDYLRFYSGDHDELAERPRLLIEYYVASR
ncbi:MAG: hypothetical protein ACOYYU_03455 [Chloroflexota bacterium]